MKRLLPTCFLLVLMLAFTPKTNVLAASIDELYPKNTDYKQTEAKNTRVFQNEKSLFDVKEDENANNNLSLLTSTNAISKDDFNYCGLKGTMKVDDNLYNITYTSDERIIVNTISLMVTTDETKYAIKDIPVYSKLDESSEIIATYSFNNPIHIVGQFENWYKIAIGEQIGYIKNENLAPSKIYLKRVDGKTFLYSNGERVGEDIDAISYGTFKTTAYCNCSICCGQWSGGNTKSGTKPTTGRTIAVDPNVIPLGTRVIIGDTTYIAEDTGSAIKQNRIDIYFGSHSSALSYGVRNCEVIIDVN